MLRVGLSAEQETATAKYVRVNKGFREILIEIAPFRGSQIKEPPPPSTKGMGKGNFLRKGLKKG